MWQGLKKSLKTNSTWIWPSMARKVNSKKLRKAAHLRLSEARLHHSSRPLQAFRPSHSLDASRLVRGGAATAPRSYFRRRPSSHSQLRLLRSFLCPGHRAPWPPSVRRIAKPANRELGFGPKIAAAGLFAVSDRCTSAWSPPATPSAPPPHSVVSSNFTFLFFLLSALKFLQLFSELRRSPILLIYVIWMLSSSVGTWEILLRKANNLD